LLCRPLYIYKYSQATILTWQSYFFVRVHNYTPTDFGYITRSQDNSGGCYSEPSGDKMYKFMTPLYNIDFCCDTAIRQLSTVL